MSLGRAQQWSFRSGPTVETLEQTLNQRPLPSSSIIIETTFIGLKSMSLLGVRSSKNNNNNNNNKTKTKTQKNPRNSLSYSHTHTHTTKLVRPTRFSFTSPTFRPLCSPRLVGCLCRVIVLRFAGSSPSDPSPTQWMHVNRV